MNSISINGRLHEAPRVMGNNPDPSKNWGLIKFWHKDGEDSEGNMLSSDRTALCSARNAQYLLDMGWGKGDEIYVTGEEIIEKKTKDNVTYTNVVIRRAQVSCGLKKGNTVNKENSATHAPAPAAAPPSAPPAAPPIPEPPASEEPRSMAELEAAFDEEEMVID